MRKYIALLSIFMFWASIASAQKISAVVFEGLQNVKEKTVRAQVKSKRGKVYSEETVKSDIQNILSLNSFDDVSVNVDTAAYRVTFRLKEKPYLKKITFKGNKKISIGKLKEEITLKEKEFYDIVKLEESKSKMTALYSDKGYADAKLETYPTVDENSNQMTLTFLITEGNRIVAGDITIEGLKTYKSKKILSLMKTKHKKIFKQDVLEKDLKEIEKFYKNNGYMQLKLGEPQVTYNQDRTLANIALAITEGPRYHVGKISFSPNGVYTDSELQKVLSIKTGQLYREEDFQESRQALLELFSNKGYLHAKVEPEFNPDAENGIMDIVFTIDEGTIVYLGKLYVDGLTSTKDFVIRREVTLKEGDVFAATKIRRSIEKIYNLGFIDGVEPEILPTSKPDVMDLGLNVTEGKPGILSAGAGYSSVDQLVGTVQIQHINLLGRAQRLNLSVEFGARKSNYDVSWTEPWFLGKPMSVGASVFDTTRVRDYGNTFSAYKEGRSGGSINVGPRFSDYLSTLFSYTYEDVTVYDVDLAVSSDVHKSHDTTSSLSYQVIWDTRDSVFDASHGNRQSLSVQYAGGPLGGTINFIKPVARSSWFFPTFWKFVFSVNGSYGLIENFGDSVVPIYERFYVGGAETVRGYKYRSEIGPAQGGKAMLVLNAEYKFPIVQEKKRTILQGAFFADAGGSWPSMNEFTLNFGPEETNLKAGVGFGIRFTTPVFPLRLDWGYGLNHRPSEELNQFYFTIGNIF